MIVRITNRCQMGCRHCMIDGSGPDGQHMTHATYMRALRFAQACAAPVVLLGGGEPTEHPDFCRFLELAHGVLPVVVVTSNGDFVDKPDVVAQLARFETYVQVTNDPRYYPRAFQRDLFEGRGLQLYFADTLQTIFPCRRVREHGIEPTKRYPGCVNLRNAVRQYGLQNGLMGLAFSGKQCPPSVDVDGTVHAGETDTCHVLGKVDDPLEVVEHRLATMRCNNCGLRDNLKPEHLALIGEAS